MATKLFGDVKAGATSVSRPALLLKAADGTPDAGKVAADLTAYYYRQGASATVPVTPSDLANLNTAFTAGGVKEIADGAYRVDWPDLAFAAGADFVLLTVKDGTTSAYTEAVAIEAHGADDVFGGMSTYAGADTSGTTSLLALAGGGSGFAAIKGDSSAIKARTDALPTAPADETLVISATNAIMARLGAPAAGSIAADIATRSTYAGGVVAGVTAPVTVGTNNDKAGYSLAPAGLDAITVDSGHNLRQVAALDHAVLCGTVSGQDANAPVFRSGGGSTTRVSAATDSNGNRTSVTLAPPA